MIKRELRSLTHNKILLLVVAAITVIPFIYAGLFLKSMWDPYGSLEQLPVAVVNEDQPVEYEGQTLSIGNDMVEAMKDSRDLDFHFTDEKSARDGLANGTWYMVITIPEDFSGNAATLLDEEPQKMELRYETNPGTNYIASKMSETALARLRDEVASRVTETYTEVLFDRIAQAGEGMQEASDGAGVLAGGVAAASDGSGELTENMKRLEDSTLTFADGADTLDKGLKEYTEGVGRVNDGAAQLKLGADAAQEELPRLTAGTHSLDEGVKVYAGGVELLHSRSGQLLSASEELGEGASGLAEGLEALAGGADQYVSAVNTFVGQAAAYAQGAGELEESSRQLASLEDLGEVSEGISEVNRAVSGGDTSLAAGAERLGTGLEEVHRQMRALSDSTSDRQIREVADALGSAGTELEEAQSDVDRLAGDMREAAEGISQASDTVRSAGGSISDAEEQTESARTTVSEAAGNAGALVESCVDDANERISAAGRQAQGTREAMTEAARELEGIYSQLLAEGSVPGETLEGLNTVIQSLYASAGSQQGPEGLDKEAYMESARQISESASGSLDSWDRAMAATAEQMEQTAGSLAEVQELLAGSADALDKESSVLDERAGRLGTAQEKILPVQTDELSRLADEVGGLCGEAEQMSEEVGETARTLGQLEKASEYFPEAAKGVGGLRTGLEALAAENTALAGGADSLKAAGGEMLSAVSAVRSGGRAVAGGMAELDRGIRTYADGVSSLAAGSTVLTEGTGQLADGVDAMTVGMDRFASGTASLFDGTAQLTENSGTLIKGADSLSGGARQIHSGAARLYEGAEALDLGMKELQSGSEELAAGLQDGAGQAGRVKAGDQTVGMFASPLDAKETELTVVENNGHAMAPYMMSVGLWVGCLAFCLMYPLTKYTGRLKGGFSWWASKAVVLYPVAALQGLLLILLLHAVDGFAPAEMTKTVLFACLTAAAFTSIMYYFNITLGKVGSFLMLIFMVVQLSGSAGTYPVELSPPFVARIHDWLPFTYTVDAFRSTICGGESILSSVVLMAVLTAAFTGLTILQFRRMARRRNKGQRLLIDWLEEKGLA